MYALGFVPYFSGQGWFDTVQDVLQADWHDAWHDSQSGRSFFQSGSIAGTMCFWATLSLFTLFTVTLLSKPRNPCLGAKYDYMGDGEEINSIIVLMVALQA